MKMDRTIIIRDGIFYDDKGDAITPTLGELMAITTTVYKYTSDIIGEATK